MSKGGLDAVKLGGGWEMLVNAAVTRFRNSRQWDYVNGRLGHSGKNYPDVRRLLGLPLASGRRKYRGSSTAHINGLISN